MSWLHRRDMYANVAARVFPARLTTREGWFWGLLSWLAWALSLGHMSKAGFRESICNGVGAVNSYPRRWNWLPLPTVLHEATHSLQCERCGWLVPVLGWFLGRRVRAWCGTPIWLVLYALPYVRYHLELHAEANAWAHALDAGWVTPRDVHDAAGTWGANIGGPLYFYAWFKSAADRGFRDRAKVEVARWMVRRARAEAERRRMGLNG